MAYATTCCTVVALDAAAKPLRPALMWMDVRAHAEADAILATGADRLKLNGDGAGPVSAEWMLPKAAAKQPVNIFHQATSICEYQDYLTLRLTGVRCASLNNIGLRWHYANREGSWPTDLLAALDLSELLEKWPERARPGEVMKLYRRKPQRTWPDNQNQIDSRWGRCLDWHDWL